MVGTNGSAAYADIDTGVAIALMRNRFSPDFTAIARLDDIVAKAYPPPAGSPQPGHKSGTGDGNTRSAAERKPTRRDGQSRYSPNTRCRCAGFDVLSCW